MLYLLLYQQIVYVKYMQSFHCQYFKTVIHYFLNMTPKESCSHTFILYFSSILNFPGFFFLQILIKTIEVYLWRIGHYYSAFV